MSGRLSTWDWRKVRQIVLTVNRESFSDGQEAYEMVSDKKLIPGFVRNLCRTAHIKVSDWLWCLEFHKDGFPHWHLFVQNEGTMIGGDIIRKYWPWAKWVHESYIKSEGHWKEITGYLKKGYLEKKKAYQGNLPSWGMTYDRRIRKYGQMVHRKRDGEKMEKKESARKIIRERIMRPYGVILEDCGENTRVMISFNGEMDGWAMVRKIYTRLENLTDGFEFIKGVGYVADMSIEELHEWLKSNLSLCGLQMEVETKYMEMDFGGYGQA